MTWQEHENNPLWQILVDTVHTNVMYPHHKAYTRDTVLTDQPQITAQELALKLNISLGESLVILYELQKTTDQTRLGTARQPEPQKP